MGKRSKKAVLLSTLLIIATFLLGGCGSIKTSSSSMGVTASDKSIESASYESAVSSTPATSSSTVSQGTAGNGKLYEIKQTYYKQYKTGDGTLIGIVEYDRPVFYGNSETAKKINAIYDNLEKAFIKKYTSLDVIKAYDSLTTEQKTEIEKGQYDQLGVVKCSVKYNKNDIISFLTTDTEQGLGGNHPESVEAPNTFDLKTGDQIGLSDVLKVTKADVTNILYAEFFKQFQKRADDFGAPDVTQKFVLQESSMSIPFFLSADGVHICYGYMFSYAQGLIDLIIPYTRNDLVKPPYAEGSGSSASASTASAIKTDESAFFNNISKTLSTLKKEHPMAKYTHQRMPNADAQCFGDSSASYSYYFFSTQTPPTLDKMATQYGDKLKCAGIATTVGVLFPQTTNGMLLKDFFSAIGVSNYKYWDKADDPRAGWIEFNYKGMDVYLDTIGQDNFQKISTMKSIYSVIISNADIEGANYNLH